MLFLKGPLLGFEGLGSLIGVLKIWRGEILYTAYTTWGGGGPGLFHLKDETKQKTKQNKTKHNKTKTKEGKTIIKKGFKKNKKK